MLSALWLLPVAPLLGFALLAMGGRRLSHGAVSAIGVGSVAVSAAALLAVQDEEAIGLVPQRRIRKSALAVAANGLAHGDGSHAH